MSVQALSCAIAVRGVSASEKLLLLVLANYADDKMTCWPSHRKLAAEACLTERTILTLLKGLEAKTIISRQERFRQDGSRTTDAITLHFSGEVISPPGESDNRGVGKLTTGGGAQISPLTTFEPSEEPSIEPGSDADASGAVAPLDPDGEAWRRGRALLVIRGGMSEAAAGRFIGKAISAFGIEARDLLGPIGEAEANATSDPQGFLMGAARARARKREATGPPKRVGWV